MLVFTISTEEVASACPEGLQTSILSRASRSLLRQVFLTSIASVGGKQLSSHFRT